MADHEPATANQTAKSITAMKTVSLNVVAAWRTRFGHNATMAEATIAVRMSAMRRAMS